MRASRLFLAAALALPAACDPAPDEEAWLQGRVNAYAQALHDGDEASLERILSQEVLDRAKERGGLARFAARQRASMLRQFRVMEGAGIGEGFRVERVEPQGDVAAVHLSFGGKEIPRPFYFVREGGELKLNVARPGFSRGLGPAFSANEDYKVDNNSGTVARIACARDSGLGWNNYQIPVFRTRSVSCHHICGFWEGSMFQSDSHQWVGKKRCEYNFWGNDVNLYDTNQGPQARCEEECGG